MLGLAVCVGWLPPFCVQFFFCLSAGARLRALGTPRNGKHSAVWAFLYIDVATGKSETCSMRGTNESFGHVFFSSFRFILCTIFFLDGVGFVYTGDAKANGTRAERCLFSFTYVSFFLFGLFFRLLFRLFLYTRFFFFCHLFISFSFQSFFQSYFFSWPICYLGPPQASSFLSTCVCVVFWSTTVSSAGFARKVSLHVRTRCATAQAMFRSVIGHVLLLCLCRWL